MDAFSLDWAVFNLSYCFSPFSVVGRVLKKVREERTTIIMVAPMWNTQSWYPTLVRMLIDFPLVFPASRANLYLPHRPSETHPLKGKLHLMAVKLSGRCSEISDFRRKLKTWSMPHGETTPGRDTMVYCKSGKSFVVDGERIPFTLM